MSIEHDKPREFCGIAGVYGHEEAANLVYLMLYALQHRGQEGAGIVSSSSKGFHSVRNSGLVADVFHSDNLRTLEGPQAIGHVRYSTTGASVEKNNQPIMVEYARGNLALAHNGNIVNAPEIKQELEDWGSIFQTTADTETLIHLIAKSTKKDFVQSLLAGLERLKGAYSMILLNDHGMYAMRDPQGFRPLVLGRLKDAYVLASETCAFDLIGATYERDIEPGEIISIDDKGLQSYHFNNGHCERASCIFEHIYFARPDSLVFGHSCWEARKRLGCVLAEEDQQEADVVIPVPDSGVCTAIGYAQQAKVDFEMGLIRNHYIGRTFIEPSQSIRDFGVKLKFNVVKEVVKGKRVIVIDDSLVRGTTARKIVKMIRNAGAKEIHMRLSSPAVMYPCFYGMDFPTRQELIASTHTLDEIARYLRVDSVAYLSQSGMLKAMAHQQEHFCTACFDGNYPVDFSDRDRMSNQEVVEKQINQRRIKELMEEEC